MKFHILLFAVVVIQNLCDCVTAVEPPLLLVSRRGTIDGINIYTGQKTTVVGGFGNAIDVDYDYEDKQIFVNDVSRKQISV